MTQLNVMVTGASRGIGRAIALRFGREGARVVLGARTATALDELAGEIEALGGVGIPCQMNVADLGNVEAGMYRTLEATDGVLDVLVNNAGIFSIKPITEMRAADFTRWAAFQLSRLGTAIIARTATMAAATITSTSVNPSRLRRVTRRTSGRHKRRQEPEQGPCRFCVNS